MLTPSNLIYCLTHYLSTPIVLTLKSSDHRLLALYSLTSRHTVISQPFLQLPVYTACSPLIVIPKPAGFQLSLVKSCIHLWHPTTVVRSSLPRLLNNLLLVSLHFSSDTEDQGVYQFNLHNRLIGLTVYTCNLHFLLFYNKQRLSASASILDESSLRTSKTKRNWFTIQSAPIPFDITNPLRDSDRGP